MSVSRVLGYLKQADNDFNLINEGDRIAVGISGGKDSFILAKCLQELKRHSKYRFDLTLIHARLLCRRRSLIHNILLCVYFHWYQ